MANGNGPGGVSHLRLKGHVLTLDRPRIMGILNVTPDSFSDGGEFLRLERALEQARRLVAEGADIIDIGGESTRPGAAPVPEKEELARVIPVIRALSAELDVPLSVDTSKPEVMRQAVAAGAAMINDVNALRAPGALEAAADSGAAVCLMHMRGTPREMQRDPRYGDVVAEVASFLEERWRAARAVGIPEDALVLDPGFGFGKTVAHNLTLFTALPALSRRAPLLVGLSRKSLIGALTGREDPKERIHGSVAMALLAAQRGAAILRVHDVAATIDALRCWIAVEETAHSLAE